MMIGTSMLFLLAQGAAPAATPRVPELPTRARAEAQVRALFDGRDANKDGKVTRAEANAFHAAQLSAMDAQQRQTGAATFAKVDTNKDGMLSLQEFLGGARPIPQVKETWFDVNDADRNGQVDLVEATTRTQRSFDAIDTNRDGTLSQQELRAADARSAQAATAARPSATSGR